MATKITITGVSELKADLIDATEQAFAEINMELITPVRNLSPMGASGRLKKDGWKLAPPHREGAILTAGIDTHLPYAAKQNIERLRHYAGSEGSRDRGDSFRRSGKERAGWAESRYGKDSKQFEYARGYRRDMKADNYDTYEARFVEGAMKEVGVKAEVKEQGDELVYYVDASERVQEVVDRTVE